MKKETVKNVLSDLKRHHVEQDNERLREALRSIRDICAEYAEPLYTGSARAVLLHMRTVGKIADAALVSAAPENMQLRRQGETA